MLKILNQKKIIILEQCGMKENYWMGIGQQKVHWTLKVNKAFLGEKAQFGPKKTQWLEMEVWKRV